MPTKAVASDAGGGAAAVAAGEAVRANVRATSVARSPAATTGMQRRATTVRDAACRPRLGPPMTTGQSSATPIALRAATSATTSPTSRWRPAVMKTASQRRGARMRRRALTMVSVLGSAAVEVAAVAGAADAPGPRTRPRGATASRAPQSPTTSTTTNRCRPATAAGPARRRTSDPGRPRPAAVKPEAGGARPAARSGAADGAGGGRGETGTSPVEAGPRASGASLRLAARASGASLRLAARPSAGSDAAAMIPAAHAATAATSRPSRAVTRKMTRASSSSVSRKRPGIRKPARGLPRRTMVCWPRVGSRACSTCRAGSRRSES